MFVGPYVNRTVWRTCLAFAVLTAALFTVSTAFALSIEQHGDTWLVTGASHGLDVLARTSSSAFEVYSFENGHWVKTLTFPAHHGINHWTIPAESSKILLRFPHDNESQLSVKPAEVKTSNYAIYNETCGNGIGYSIPDPTMSWNPHYCQGGRDCCNWYVKSHVHDLQKELTGNYSIYLTYRPGLVSGCSSPLYVYVSSDNQTWIKIFNGTSTSNDLDGDPSYPQDWQDYSLTLNYDGTFRWVKVSIPDCYVDWSYITVTNATSNQAPIANFTMPLGAYSGEDVLLNASSSYDPDGDKLTYHWKIGDHSDEYGKEVTHKFNVLGNVSVELTVSDPYGASDEMVRHIILHKPVKITYVNATTFYNGVYYTNRGTTYIQFSGYTEKGYNVSVDSSIVGHTNGNNFTLSLQEGNHTVCVSAGFADHESQSCVNISYNPQPPSCSISSVKVFGNFAVMKYTCDEPLSKAFFWNDANTTVLVDTSPGVTKFPDLPDGKRILHLIPQDIAGNNGTELNATVVINANPPTITWVSPDDGQEINDNAVNVSVYSKSQDIQSLYAIVYNSTWNSTWQVMTLNAEPDTVYSLVISGLSNGTYNVSVEAVDNNSNYAIYTRHFIVNVTKIMPTVEITFPTKEKPVYDPVHPGVILGYIFYNWTCSNRTVDRVQFNINDPKSSTFTCKAYLDGKYQNETSGLSNYGDIKFGSVVSTPGWHSVRVLCVDEYDSSRIAEQTVKFYVDDTPPTVDFVGPNGARRFPNNFHNGTYWTNNMRIYLNVADKRPGVMRVYIGIYDNGSLVQEENTTNPVGWFQPNTANLDGSQHKYTICVWAEDRVNNQSPVVCRNVTFDTQAPETPDDYWPGEYILMYFNDISIGAYSIPKIPKDLETCWFVVHDNLTNENTTIYDNDGNNDCYTVAYLHDCENPKVFCYNATYYVEDWAGNLGVFHDGPFGVDGNGPNVTIDTIFHNSSTDEANITFEVSGDNVSKVEYRYVYVPLNKWDNKNHRPCGDEVAFSDWYPVDGNVSNVNYPITPGQKVTFHVNDLPESGYFCNGTRFDPRIQMRAYNSNDRIGQQTESQPLYVDSWWRKIYYSINPIWDDAYAGNAFDVYLDIDYVDDDLRFNNSFIDEPPNTQDLLLVPNVTFDYNLDDGLNLSSCWLVGIENPYSDQYFDIYSDFLERGWWATIGDDPSLNYTHYLSADGNTWDGYRYPGYEETDAVWECDIGVIPYSLHSTLRMRLWNGTVVNITASSSNEITPYSPGPGGLNLGIGSATGKVPERVREIITKRVMERLRAKREGGVKNMPKIETSKALAIPALSYPGTFIINRKKTLPAEKQAVKSSVKEKKISAPEKHIEAASMLDPLQLLSRTLLYLVIVSLVPIVIVGAFAGRSRRGRRKARHRQAEAGAVADGVDEEAEDLFS